MLISEFKRQFKEMNFIYLTKDIVLFRRPLEIYSFKTKETLAIFKGREVEVTFDFKVEGKTIRQLVEEWSELYVPTLNGGNGSSSDAFSNSWKFVGGGGGGNSEKDLPARMNVKRDAKSRTYQDMVDAFNETYSADNRQEHGVVVDEQGFATQLVHGEAGSVDIRTNNRNEMVIHNHPAAGWPTFSKEDVYVAAQTGAKGIVAVSSRAGRSAETVGYAGTYTFAKGNNFDANGFMKALDRARITGKDYNDAVDRWLRRNQKKYGYTYTYEPAKR